MTQTVLPVVLLVDDELSLLEALERDLRSQFQCLKSQNFQQAKAHLKERDDIVVLLSDEKLLKTSGLDLLRWTQQHKPLVVRCLISGKVNAESISHHLEEGTCHRFFQKPWEPDILRLQLKECLVMAHLLRESKLDPLTGLLNRRGFDEQLQMEIERAERHKRPLALVMWDLDNFKLINDNLGHGGGDRILKRFAQHLRKSLRNIDYVARLGGDEFAIILPDTAREEAFQVAQRIQSSMKDESTVSGGVVVFKNEKKDQLLEKADVALYRAKQLGKNQVQVQD